MQVGAQEQPVVQIATWVVAVSLDVAGLEYAAFDTACDRAAIRVCGEYFCAKCRIPVEHKAFDKLGVEVGDVPLAHCRGGDTFPNLSPASEVIFERVDEVGRDAENNRTFPVLRFHHQCRPKPPNWPLRLDQPQRIGEAAAKIGVSQVAAILRCGH